MFFPFPVITLLDLTVYYLMKQIPMDLPQASETFSEFGPSLTETASSRPFLTQKLRMRSVQTAGGVVVERPEGRFHQ